MSYRSGYLAGSARRVSRRTMMATALAAFAVPTVAVLEAPASDPVFSAIEQHRQGWSALASARDDDEYARLHDAVLAAESELVKTQPTTNAGVVALRHYHRDWREREYLYPRPAPYEHEYYYPGYGKG